FAEPIELDLDGGQIREMRKNANNEYLILASPSEPELGDIQETEWVWNGEPNSQPVRLQGQLPGDLANAGEGAEGVAAWEGSGGLPEHLTAGAPVRLLMDQGSNLAVTGEKEQKEYSVDVGIVKSRTDLVPLGAPVDVPAAVTGLSPFGEQAEGTIS